MARSRLIKPGFFANELLAELSFEARLCFAGLWTLADRDGRLEDRPKRIGAALFPYDTVDIEAILIGLADRGFITRYRVKELAIIAIPTFADHQKPHQRENASVLPSPIQVVPEHNLGSAEAQPRRPCTCSVSVPISVSVPKTVSVSDPKDKAVPAARPSDSRAESPDDNVGVITKIAHEAIDSLGADHPDLAETVKSFCATRNIAYRSAVVLKALDSARVQRKAMTA